MATTRTPSSQRSSRAALPLRAAASAMAVRVASGTSLARVTIMAVSVSNTQDKQKTEVIRLGPRSMLAWIGAFTSCVTFAPPASPGRRKSTIGKPEARSETALGRHQLQIRYGSRYRSCHGPNTTRLISVRQAWCRCGSVCRNR